MNLSLQSSVMAASELDELTSSLQSGYTVKKTWWNGCDICGRYSSNILETIT